LKGIGCDEIIVLIVLIVPIVTVCLNAAKPFSLFSGKRQINREGEKENCAEDLRNNLRRGELYGFDNRAITFGGHVNFFE
jgi:hypothetical protein